MCKAFWVWLEFRRVLFRSTVEKAHGQIETRRYEVINDTAWLRKEHPDWGHIQCIGKASITIDKEGKQGEDTRYFVLSCQVSAKELCAYVRGHWQIESLPLAVGCCLSWGRQQDLK